jgi:hypothetical protein
MWDALFWIYLVNSTLLITHEIDSAYWKEWELFRLPGGIAFFLILHLPLVFLLLYGTALVGTHSPGGLVLSTLTGLGGLTAFGLHITFIAKGRPEFKTPISLALLTATLGVSIVQLGLVAYMWIHPAA